MNRCDCGLGKDEPVKSVNDKVGLFVVNQHWLLTRRDLDELNGGLTNLISTISYQKQ